MLSLGQQGVCLQSNTGICHQMPHGHEQMAVILPAAVRVLAVQLLRQFRLRVRHFLTSSY